MTMAHIILSSICLTVFRLRDIALSAVPSTISGTGPYAAFVVGAAAWVVFSTLRRRRTLPGPPRLPILGNMLQIPAVTVPYVKFTEWSREYGPVYSLDLPGQHIGVVNTYKTAMDLLDRCSAIYNHRPRFIMAHEILSDYNSIILDGDTEMWRRWRRTTGESFSPEGVLKYRSAQAQATALGMLRTLTNPNAWEHNFEVMAASAMFTTVYGRSALESEKHLSEIHCIYELARKVPSSTFPGAYLVDSYPIMKYLPTWAAKWKREGLKWNERMLGVFSDIIADAKANKTVDDMEDNYASDLLRSQHRHKFTEKESTWISAVMVAAGSDTTITILLYFVLAMVNYPDVMHKAQAQLDKVVGKERLPTFDDWDDLPYIRALVRETMRWRPVAPLGVQHVATEDNWYEGYYIPKGTVVLGNIWAMNRDPSIHPDFNTFRPERFFDKSEKEWNIPADTHQIGHTTFGFGRRTCVGMHFADQSLFIIMATMLWAFNIKPAVDEKGDEVVPSPDDLVVLGAVVRPQPFKCRIIPRFPEVEEILEARTNNI